jgi:peptidoglycan/LPS O-acetylase OafA/YrhL
VQTIGERQDVNRGVGGSFDLIRLSAAVAVLFSHAMPLTTGRNDGEIVFALSQGRTTVGDLAVDVFFVTSGFLVTGSLFRSRNLLDFGWRRSVRILPALVAVVLVCAFVVGPILTVIGWRAYFIKSETYEYILNALFVFRPSLPGVFSTNPYPDAVNGSLWTLFYEAVCYLCVAATMLVRRAANSLIVLAFAVLSVAAIYQRWPGRMEHLVVLGSYFFAGAALYALRDRTPYNLAAFAIAVLTCGLIPVWGVAPAITQFAMAYACIWLGYRRSWEPPGDYSYGIYLWAFPIQQVLVSVFRQMSWWENIAAALPITVAIAYLSWTFIEARAMKSKNMIARFHARS